MRQIKLNWAEVSAMAILPTLKRIQMKLATNRLTSLEIQLYQSDESVPEVLSLLSDTLTKMNALETLTLQSHVMLDEAI
jgi:hypothetical protein